MRSLFTRRIGAVLLAATAAFASAPSAATQAVHAAAGLPTPLSDDDAERYRTIFELQQDGRWRAADRLIEQIEDTVLLGHVQAQRYLHPTKYRSRYRELAAWLRHYADHPDAARIYKIALRRKPKGASGPMAPKLPRGVVGSGDPSAADSVRARFSVQARRVNRRVRGLVRRQRLTVAEDYLERADVRRRLRPQELSAAWGRVAAGWYYYGKDEKALAVADRATAHADTRAVTAHWYGGLAAYRLGRYDKAAWHFEEMVAAGDLRAWSRAAAAFWAARANMAARNPEKVSRLLRAAAEEPRTFYGLLARRILGIDSPFDWNKPVLDEQDIATVMASKRAHRALALLQVGQRTRAEAELRFAARDGDPALRRSLLALADELNLPSLAFNTAATLNETEGRLVERALYPVPRWTPSGGFIVDRALIFAVVRQESAFNVRAKSRAGARGLMQLMPGTAGYMANRRFRGSRRHKLYDPTLNLTLGQKYLRYLLQHELVQGDMFRLAAAYNGGPGNLAKWNRRVSRLSDDPLLFIESLPSGETRNFIERVLANLWLYRERLGQQAPSLDALAAGKSPFYKSLDRALVAETPPDARN